MENSKRIKRALKNLEKLEQDMDFYTNGCMEYREEFQQIRELINELALDKKEDHARFAKKLKALWSSSEKNNES